MDEGKIANYNKLQKNMWFALLYVGCCAASFLNLINVFTKTPK